MTVLEIAGWLTAHGWVTEVVDDDTVTAARPGRPPRMYLREPSLLGERWRIVVQKHARPPPK